MTEKEQKDQLQTLYRKITATNPRVKKEENKNPFIFEDSCPGSSSEFSSNLLTQTERLAKVKPVKDLSET